MITAYSINSDTKQFMSPVDVETLSQNLVTVPPTPYNSSIGEALFWSGTEWYTKIVDRSLFFAALRVRRDELLAETDWTQTADAKLSEELQVQVREYRQALRDITKQDPNNFAWPVNPLAK